MSKSEQLKQMLEDILQSVRTRTNTPSCIYKVAWAGETKVLVDYSDGYYVHIGNLPNNKIPSRKKSDFYFRYSFRLYMKKENDRLELSIKFWQPSYGPYSKFAKEILKSDYPDGLNAFLERMVDAIEASRVPMWAYPRGESFLKHHHDKILFLGKVLDGRG